MLFTRMGWVWHLTLPADCPPRPEVRSQDAGLYVQ
jgi:hypothetical protein